MEQTAREVNLKNLILTACHPLRPDWVPHNKKIEFARAKLRSKHLELEIKVMDLLREMSSVVDDMCELDEIGGQQ